MKSPVAWLATVTALTCAAAVAGCGLGPGASSPGTATLTVTRDYGSKTVLEATDQDPPSSETVIRFLDDEADITTRYGGGFVQSIDGLAGGASSDWFFYVNGTESPVGAAEVHVKSGDRIWWDYRNWSAAMSVPAVVGSWPEPFAQASVEKPKPVRVVCLGVRPPCETVSHRLADAGVSPQVERGGSATDAAGSTVRVLVGPWNRVGRDPAVDSLRGGPGGTGVFAIFKGPIHGDWHLIGLDQGAEPSRDFGAGSGLVAALGRSGDPATWIVTGSGAQAVRRGAAALNSRHLRNRYAVAATGHGVIPLPIVGKGRAE
jgi:Domain of unknown function (DUF4430)